MGIGGTRRQSTGDQLKVRDEAGDLGPAGQVVGQADVHQFEFADKFEGGQAEQSLFDGGHRDGEIGGEAFVGGFAGVAVHAGGAVHGNDEGRLIHCIRAFRARRAHPPCPV